MLQSVLTSKAQEAYSALSVTDSLSYAKVKSAVLKVYELTHLTPVERADLISLIRRFPGIFINTQTHLLEHDIDVGDVTPIRQRYYCVPLV